MPFLIAVVFAVVVFALYLLAKRLGLLAGASSAKAAPHGGPDVDDRDPATLCRARGEVLTAAEREFFAVLRPITAGKHGLLAKVRVGDILTVPGQGSAQTSARNRLNQKHADFVLCDANTTRPLLIIELDDKSHDTPSRKERDDFLDAAYKAAGLPILHVRAARTYSPAQVGAAIEAALGNQAAAG